jgi:hypothetical protein
MTAKYASTLNAGLGMIGETRTMMNLWNPGISATALHEPTLSSGRFPNMSAPRLRNVVVEGFAATCLRYREETMLLLRQAKETLSSCEFEQLLFLQTCRAHLIFADFVRLVCWPAYAASPRAESSRYDRLPSAQCTVVKSNRYDVGRLYGESTGGPVPPKEGLDPP